MTIQNINIENLKPSNINVRKVGNKNIDDLVPSIRANGLLQPLIVRKNCQGYEVIAGQRRYHALCKLAEEKHIDPVPCVILEEGNDAKALEASLAENFSRLPMDEIDQYKAFAALQKKGKSIEEIAAEFGLTELMVKRRLALGNLISPILNAYRKDKINIATLRSLTLATKQQQKDWWALFKSDDYTPLGTSLRNWLFGGNDIDTSVALFPLEEYSGALISDLFGDQVFFDDASAFWHLQNAVIAKKRQDYIGNGWQDVIILDVGDFFKKYEHIQASKKDGGHVYVEIRNSGKVTFHEGYITEKEHKRREKAKENGSTDITPSRPEITKAMQNYLSLHRHSAVKSALLQHPGIALRLAIAQMLAGSSLWNIEADPQKASTEEIAHSLSNSQTENQFEQARKEVRALLGMEKQSSQTLIYRKDDWGKSHNLYQVFSHLLGLDDASINKILTFIVAETLACNSAMIDGLGEMLKINMADHWKPDTAFFDLLRDKETINAMVSEAAGKQTANAHVSATAKVQKKIILDVMSGQRTGQQDWHPRYMNFPMQSYTKRGGIDAIDQYQPVRKHFR